MAEAFIHTHVFHEPRLAPHGNTFIDQNGRSAVTGALKRSHSFGGYIPHNLAVTFHTTSRDLVRVAPREAEPAALSVSPSEPCPREPEPAQPVRFLPLTSSPVACEDGDAGMYDYDMLSTCYSPRPFSLRPRSNSTRSDGFSQQEAPFSRNMSLGSEDSCSPLPFPQDVHADASTSAQNTPDLFDPWVGIAVKEVPHCPPVASHNRSDGDNSLCLTMLLPPTPCNVSNWSPEYSGAAYNVETPLNMSSSPWSSSPMAPPAPQVDPPSMTDLLSWYASSSQDVDTASLWSCSTEAMSFSEAVFYPGEGVVPIAEGWQQAPEAQQCQFLSMQQAPHMVPMLPGRVHTSPGDTAAMSALAQLMTSEELATCSQMPAAFPEQCMPEARPVGRLDTPDASAAVEHECKVPMTTVMIRNIPRTVTQRFLVRELDSTGFEGTFDFVYMPQALHSNENAGFAFVNFMEPAMAGAFIGQWHRTRLLNTSPKQAALGVCPASIQGLEANAKKWLTPRLRRIKNQNLRPLVLDKTSNTMRTLTDDLFALVLQ